jgi:putative hydrolase of the HAD superfamily
MNIKGLIFDINGTLMDINTNEEYDDIFRVLSHLLTYQGITLHHDDLRDLYHKIMKEQRQASNEHHPEFDAVAIFKEILKDHATDFTRKLPAQKLAQLPCIMAEVYRAVSRFRLRPYDGVKEVIEQLHTRYLMGIVSDGQSAWAVPELHAVGLRHYFKPIIVSGDFGYRKPDKRLFEKALADMKLAPSEAIFIGNDMYHDVFGAQQLGIKTVFFKSNQGTHEKEGVEPDYIIYNFPELLKAIQFFEKR